MKKFKPLDIVALVFQILATAIALIGSILMFFDEERSYNGFYYRSHPESGIMPAFGFLLLLVALILLIVGIMKNKKLLIGSIILSYCAQVLLYASILLLYSEETALGGYLTCVSAGCLVFVNCILMIISVAIDNTKKTQIDNVTKPINDETFYALLQSIKELLDCGAFTQEEFDNEKKKIMALRNPERKPESNVGSFAMKLQELKNMHESGLLSDEEYFEERKKIIAKM